MQHSHLLLLLLLGTLILGIPTSNSETMATMGGLRDIQDFQNSNEINEVAQFAVQEHNTKQNGVLSLRRVVKAQQQVVAGTMYYLTLEATDGVGEGAQPKLYEAKVWVKPWQNFKSLEEFKPIPQPGSITSADLGVKKDS